MALVVCLSYITNDLNKDMRIFSEPLSLTPRQSRSHTPPPAARRQKESQARTPRSCLAGDLATVGTNQVKNICKYVLQGFVVLVANVG